LAGCGKASTRGLAGIGGGLAGLGVALRKALDVGEAGAQLANLERSFTRFAESTGANADQVLANMQRMSGGMMAQSELMEQYNRSFLLMGQDMAAQMPRLMQIAAAASAAGMGDFNFMLNSLVTGLGRLSPLILDNLGFTIKASDAYERYAQSIGKSADELSKAEQQMALLNVVTEQAEDRFGDLNEAAQRMSGMGIARLRAAFRDLANQMQQDVAPTIDAAAGQIATVLRSQIRETDEWVQAQTSQLTSLLYAGINLQRVWREMQGQELGQTANIEAMMRLAETMDLARLSAEQWARMHARVSRVSVEAGKALADLRREQLLTKREQEHMISTAQRLRSATEKVGDSMSKASVDVAQLGRALSNLRGHFDTTIEGFAGIRRAYISYQKAVAGTDKPWRAEYKAGWEGTLDYVAALWHWAGREYTEVTSRISDAQDEMASRSASALSAMESAWGSYLSSYQSAIESIMQPTTGDFSEQIEQILGREETWDEMARRAASFLGDAGQAVANAMKEGWWEEYAATVGITPEMQPGEIQRASAQFLKEWQMGMHPEAINMEALARSVEESMTTKVNWENIMATVQGQLTQMGLGPMSPLAIQAFGQPLIDAGVDIAEDLSEKIEGFDWATSGSAIGDSMKTGVLTAADDPNFKRQLVKKMTPVANEVVTSIVKQLLGVP